MDGGQFFGEVEVHVDLGSLELVLQQREGFANDLVEIGFAELGGRGAGEIEQAVGDLGGAEALLGDLFEHRAQRASPAQLLREHLRVRGNDSQRRVDFVGHAGGEQADGAELVGLGELRFERDALGDVVDEDDAADGDEVAGEQRRDGDVGGALLAGAGGEAELVEVMHALLVAETVDGVANSGGKHGRRGWPMASARLRAYMASICAFQLSMRSSRSMARMPTLMDSTMFSLNSFRRSNSPIFSFEASVEAGVLQGDADVAGQRFEQFHVFAGEEVAADGAAEADHGDGARGRACPATRQGR